MIAPRRRPGGSIWRDRRGSAAIEFAFIATFLFATLIVSLDFGLYMLQKLKLGQAVEQGAMMAFNARGNQPAVNTATIGNYIVAASSGGSTVTTSFQCNGQASCDGTNTQQSMCVGAPVAPNGWPTFTAATNNICSSGATPGYYLVIRASRTFSPIVVPDKYLNNAAMQQQTIVRLS